MTTPPTVPATVPATWPPTIEYLDVVFGTPGADREIRSQALEAAVAHVAALEHVASAIEAGTVGGDTIYGTALLAARLAVRRQSLGGVIGFGELGATYVTRHDPDVSRLLRLDLPGVA